METWLIVAVVALVVGLLAAGGYVYWRYFRQPSLPLEILTAGVADYMLTNDYWSNHYWSFDYWPAYGTGVVVTKQRRMHLYDEPLIL